MKRFVFSIAFILLLLCETATACTVTIRGLREEFRRSSQIFTGEFVGFGDGSTYEIPKWQSEKWKSDATLEKATFSIKKSWKGQRSGTISLYINPTCDCPTRFFVPSKGQELVIFADKDGVVDSCNFQHVIEMKDEKSKAEAKAVTDKLDSFWFRTWARIYPF